MLVNALFNLLFNAGVSFIAGWVISWTIIKIFKIKSPQWQLYFYSLPFLKIVFDFWFIGLPDSSVVLHGLNPFILPPHHQLLTISTGARFYLLPFLQVIFSTLDIDGQLYSTSLADYVFFWLVPRIGIMAELHLLI